MLPSQLSIFSIWPFASQIYAVSYPTSKKFDTFKKLKIYKYFWKLIFQSFRYPLGLCKDRKMPECRNLATMSTLSPKHGKTRNVSNKGETLNHYRFTFFYITNIFLNEGNLATNYSLQGQAIQAIQIMYLEHVKYLNHKERCTHRS